MVETAITMPLFVFIILGSIQLALMHQARLMTKYAAYKAVRAGTLYHARVPEMEDQARAVLLPVMSLGLGGGSEKVFRTKDSASYLLNVGLTSLNALAPGIKMVEVTVCNPTQSAAQNGTDAERARAIGNGQVFGFDLPASVINRTWQEHSSTKLAIQVTLNYRMIIPFADMMLYHIYMNDQSAGLRATIRAGQSTDTYIAQTHRDGKDGTRNAYKMAGMGYIIPIRAYYSLRMNSDLFPTELPQKNNCIIPRG